MASTAVPWQIVYGMGPTASIAATNQLDKTTHIVVGTAKYAFPLTNHPNFDPGQTVIDQRKAVGIATRRAGAGFEFQQGVKAPVTTWEYDANVFNLAFPLWLMFQKGTTEGSVTALFTKTYDAPTASEGVEMEQYANLVKRMEVGSVAGGTNNSSQRMLGVVARSVTFTAESNAPLKVSFEFVGADLETNFNPGLTGEVSLFTFDTNDPLIWGASNAYAAINDTEFDCDSWNMTISNNIIQKQYAKDTVQKHIMQDFTVEGSFRMRWGQPTVGGRAQIDNFMNGTDAKFQVFWGADSAAPYVAASSGELSIQTNCRYTGAEVTTDDEVAIDLPFIGAYDGTNSAIEIELIDGMDRSI